MADLAKTRAGEVVATSTTEFEAQAVELHRAPPLGALLGVHLEDGCHVYGVVAGAYTEGLDIGARPVPRATDERQNADVYRDNPDLEHVLRTCFRCIVVGFHDGHEFRHYLPAAPEEPEALESLSGGVGLPIPQATKAAKKGQGRGEKTES